MTTAGAVAAALASALAAAASSVLQHHSARRAPASVQRLRLVPYLLGRPVWLLGGVSAIVGLVLHAVALAGGRLVVVQPLLVSGLVFALPVSLLVEHRRPQLREWLWAVAVVIGLAAFLIAAHPSAGRSSAGNRDLATATAVCLVAIAVLVVGARLTSGLRAGLLATGGGLGFGITSALLKQSAALVSHGPIAVVTNWATYGLIVTGALSVVLTQIAYRAGSLADSLPAMTISDPASSVFIGSYAFHERLASSPTAIAVELLAFALMTVAARQVSRYGPAPDHPTPAADRAGRPQRIR